MDAASRHNTRRTFEIMGYRDLGMWEEAQTMLEEFADDIVEHPEILAFMTSLDVAIQFESPKGAKAIPRFFIPTAAHAYSGWGRAELKAL